MFTAKDALYQAMAYTDKKVKGGGGGGVTPVPLTVTENGTYTAEVGQAYNPVNVNVPTYDQNSIFYATNEHNIDGSIYWDIVLVQPIVTYDNYHVPVDSIYNYTIKSSFIDSGAFRAKLYILNDLIFDNEMTEVVGFDECSIGGSVIFSNSVRSIGPSAFSCCVLGYDKQNYTLTIPEGVTTISDSAFSSSTIGDENTSMLVLPSTLESIGQYALNAVVHCIKILAIVPPNCSTEIGSSVILVPAQSVEAYKTAEGWSDYASIIEAIPTE